MTEITVSDLREKLKHDIDLAREKVRTLEEQLKWLDNVIKGNDIPLNSSNGNGNNEQTASSPFLALTHSGSEGTPGRAIRELMINAPGEFNVPGIVKHVAREFPDMERNELSKKASQIANKLAKNKKIKKIHEGAGREPHTYMSAKYTGK